MVIKKMLLFCLVVTLLLIACDPRTPDEIAADEEVFGPENSFVGQAAKIASINKRLVTTDDTTRSNSGYNSCRDPDGKNPNITSITNVNITTRIIAGQPPTIRAYAYTDRCASNNNNNNNNSVVEYYCSSERLAKATIACPASCVDGSCVSCVDADNDGFGLYCSNGIDCNDADVFISPGVLEACDSVDNNCDGQTDEGFDLQVDTNNCGQCGNACPLGKACAGAVCLDAIGEIHFKTIPDTVQVFLDGELQGATLPDTVFTISNILGGVHTLKLSSSDFEDYITTVTIPAGNQILDLGIIAMSLKEVLIPEAVNVRIESYPEGATVLIDGTALPGTTPLTATLTPLPGEPFEIRLVKDHLQDISTIQFFYSVEKGWSPIKYCKMLDPALEERCQ